MECRGQKPSPVPGASQPDLPGELGFYDLRVPETRYLQAQLAKEHGITGFLYYHYWFGGRRMLERPFKEVLESGSPDFPFALCWANESWYRRWQGTLDEMILEQVSAKKTTSLTSGGSSSVSRTRGTSA